MRNTLAPTYIPMRVTARTAAFMPGKAVCELEYSRGILHPTGCGTLHPTGHGILSVTLSCSLEWGEPHGTLHPTGHGILSVTLRCPLEWAGSHVG